MNLGTHMLLRGYIVNGWCKALVEKGVSSPERVTKAILNYLWDTVDSLWEIRNDILHLQRNLTHDAEESGLAESLVWYAQHKHEVLAAFDHHLARFDAADIHRMPRRVKREWKRHLDAARNAFNKEKRQRGLNQNVITRYLLPRDPPADAAAAAPRGGPH